MLDSLLTILAKGLTGVATRCLDMTVFDGPHVYYANHSSHLDMLVIRSALPGYCRRQTFPVAAKDFWAAGRVRRFIACDVLNAVLLDRKHHRRLPEELDTLSKMLDEGKSLIIFPEGTRSLTGELDSFKSGIYRLATRRPETAFVPIWLDNLNQILPKGEVLPVPFVCSATVGRAFCMTPGEARADFLSRARNNLIMLKERKEEYGGS